MPLLRRLSIFRRFARPVLSSKVTIHEVARMSGVSIKTVSRVLNREPNVKTDTRTRVQEAVAALNYRPNISARSLAGRRPI
jgi:LacI family transcriptional regulator